MNISDKIEILDIRIKSIEFSISEHIRILKEDILQEGDEQVINESLSRLYKSLNALNSYMQVLTNSL